MVYTQAVRRALLKWRQKNKDSNNPKVAEQVGKHRLKWKSYIEEVKRLNKIGQVF